MGQKDISEKTLEAYNDVFADIVNVLLFKGKPLVKEDKLEEASPVSYFKADNGKLHEETRDVAKYWIQSHKVRLALLGLENQTCDDPYMALRTIAYDGASYKQQLTELLSKSDTKLSEGQALLPYPVVTIVLYFGYKRWKKPKSLLKTLLVPPELRPYVNDYRINLFEVSFLTEEQINMFKSDFKIVADYFVKSRKNKNYAGSKETFKHVNEVLQMMRAVTGDLRYSQLNDFVASQKGKPITMCKVLDEIENRGILKGKAEGIAEGIAEGKKEGQLSLVSRLIKKGLLTLKQAAEELGMTPKKLEVALNNLAKSTQKS